MNSIRKRIYIIASTTILRLADKQLPLMNSRTVPTNLLCCTINSGIVPQIVDFAKFSLFGILLIVREIDERIEYAGFDQFLNRGFPLICGL